VRSTLPHFKADLFKALAHPPRIRILELLRGGERTVTDLQAALGVEASAVSQQLAILRTRNILTTRKAGTSVYYCIADPAIFTVLDGAHPVSKPPGPFTESLARRPSRASGRDRHRSSLTTGGRVCHRAAAPQDRRSGGQLAPGTGIRGSKEGTQCGSSKSSGNFYRRSAGAWRASSPAGSAVFICAGAATPIFVWNASVPAFWRSLRPARSEARR